MPRGIGGESRVDILGDESEIGRCELPFDRMTLRLAPGLQLLEVRELAYIDLGLEMPAQGLLERLAGLEVSARKRPGPGLRRARSLPQERLQPAFAHLEDDGEGDVRGAQAACFRLTG